MLDLITAGMALGLLGSFHCIGMCGPLALSLPINSDNLFVKFSGTLLYNAGRVITYSCIGLFFGMIGRSFAFFGFQQWLSIIMGSVILLFLIIGKRFEHLRMVIPGITIHFDRLRKALGDLADDAAGSNDAVAGFNGFEQLLLLLGARTLRADQEEIEDDHHQHEHAHAVKHLPLRIGLRSGRSRRPTQSQYPVCNHW